MNANIATFESKFMKKLSNTEVGLKIALIIKEAYKWIFFRNK